MKKLGKNMKIINDEREIKIEDNFVTQFLPPSPTLSCVSSCSSTTFTLLCLRLILLSAQCIPVGARCTASRSASAEVSFLVCNVHSIVHTTTSTTTSSFVNNETVMKTLCGLS